ncbi:MAG: acetyl-CoA carboxylase biotin carboxylase subunit [Epulopiscium sp.]|nr:acetyl-CoA carboxylase biotin carboxylase subunit [Candidatus Epulonipiscium sp.]
MFKKILIANRGEIAVRIIRTCREMNIETVAIYSEGDKEALHVQMADEAICVGPAKTKDSYLNMENIISATILSGAEAIHPGFGFLSENSKFAKMCQECNIVFIGPLAEQIDLMGNKSQARKTMIKANVPVVPGSEGAVCDVEEGLILAKKIGFPIMIKASSGGGGRGMRVATNEEEFKKSFRIAQNESQNAFGDSTMYLERFIENPRHIEFQILADQYGHVIHLGERDCSIQRRHQKIIEETPSPAMTEELREAMGAAAIRAAQAIGYQNAGTVEFLLDSSQNFYFMEMNTRIQVEHPITEMVTGIDLIEEQIKIAAGQPLSYQQEEITIRGHAIECRINAEDPSKDFMPSPGRITELHVPGGLGVRVDSAVYYGYTIPPYYDSMVAKLIVHGENREKSLAKMKRALGEFIIQGVHTNIDFQYDILHDEDFQKGEFDTSFIAKKPRLGQV